MKLGIVEYVNTPNDVFIRKVDTGREEEITEMFYSGKLLMGVNLEDFGEFRLSFTYEDEDNIRLLTKEKFVEWIEVPI